MAKKKLNVQGIEINLDRFNDKDYISLTDIAKNVNEEGIKPANTIQNWMKNANTLRYLSTWEQVHNPDFKVIHLEDFIVKSTDNRTIISPQKWISTTNALGLVSKSGRYGGGTFAHQEIALDFCYWLSPEFKVYLNKEFLRLKEEESERQSLDWHISKITDNIDEVRNLLDSIPGQKENRKRLK